MAHRRPSLHRPPLRRAAKLAATHGKSPGFRPPDARLANPAPSQLPVFPAFCAVAGRFKHTRPGAPRAATAPLLACPDSSTESVDNYVENARKSLRLPRNTRVLI